MDEAADAGATEPEASDLRAPPLGADPVARSRALERAARRALASDDLDDRSRRAITSACEQLAADRTNGENLDVSIRRLRDLLDDATREPARHRRP